MRLGHDVLVLDRNDRNVEANHPAGLAGKITRSRHDVFSSDVAFVGLDQPLARRQLLDAE